jgi:hypothetical protein
MNLKKLLWLPLGGTAIICATCAPVGLDPRSAKEAEPEKPAGPVEVVEKMPVAATGPRFKIESAIENIRSRQLLTTNGFWTVFHGILGLGPGLTLRNPDTGEKVNAVEFIASGGEMRGLTFLPTKYGLDVETGRIMAVSQGHQDQFIAEVGAEWGMPADKKFIVFGKDYTFLDFVNESKMRASVTKNQELSWTIVIVGQYLGQDITWTNKYGEKLTYEDMIRYELDASVEQAACGGTHRLFGLTWAYHQHLMNGGETVGVWKEIAEKTAKYRDLAKKFQNPDGTLSTNHFRGAGNAPEKATIISTAGHMVEWLALALTDAELKEKWMQDAAGALAQAILDVGDTPQEGGALYHAAHGLLLYHARVYDRYSVAPRELMIPLPPDKAFTGEGP